jgi:hypothetical protein
MERIGPGRAGRVRRSSLLALVTACALAAPATAGATTTTQVITSAGPLSNIWVGNDLDCQVQYGTLSSYEFFPPNSAPGDCGTFLSVTAAGGAGTPNDVYGPDLTTNPGSTSTGFTPGTDNYVAYTPQPQTPVTGAGTGASPYTVTSTVTAGPGVTITETDNYVVGNLYYQSDITVHNGATGSLDGYLYKGADCYLQGSDSGYGALSGTAPECTQNPNNSPAGELEAFAPVTPAGNDYYEEAFGAVWGAIGAGGALPNMVAAFGTGTSDSPSMQDNGAAIDWPVSLRSGTSETFSVQTTFFGTPVSTGGLPTISGAATYGSTLTEGHGTYNPAATGYAYQWQDCDSSGNNCTGIEGATGPSYRVAAGDIGHRIVVTETASNGAGATTTLNSAPTAVVPATPVTLTTRQTSGTTSGPTLSVPAGTTGEIDRATLNGPNAALAGGTIVYSLYSKPSCVSSSRVFTSSSQTVLGTSAPASNPVTNVLAPGTYYWQAIYSGDLANAGAASSCGPEKLTVTPGTVVSNQASSNGKTLQLTLGCTVVPCTLAIKVTVTERVAVPASADLASKKVRKRFRNKTVTVAIESVTIRKIKKKKKGVHNQVSGIAIDAPLTKAGEHYLTNKRRHHTKHVKLKLKIVEKIKHKTLVASTSSINVALDAPAAKH